MSVILGIDLEGMNQDLANSGLNLKVDRVIEIGAVLWDWQLGQPIKVLTELIDEPDRLEISKEVFEITGISEAMLKKYGKGGETVSAVLNNLRELIREADFLMAHNAKGYDRPMLQAIYQRYGMELPDKVWIDTMSDIEYPLKIKSRSMAMLEYSHGFINPFPHRAFTDALAMLKVAHNYDLERMIVLAKSPTVKIFANSMLLIGKTPMKSKSLM